jgi:hypothetical protein
LIFFFLLKNSVNKLSSHLVFVVTNRHVLFLLLLQHFCTTVLHRHGVLLLHFGVSAGRGSLDSLFVGEFRVEQNKALVHDLE